MTGNDHERSGTMTDMAKHSAAKGGPLHRAWISAWIVTIVMGGATMTFQVYHSITRGQMPWPLAVLYGVVPLLIAMLVLEIVAEWRDSPWVAKSVAYLIMAGAMFLSASATGAVVLYAAPPHWSLLFGALLDAAELLAAYFIMNGPRAADAAAAAAERTAEHAAREAAAAQRETERQAAFEAAVDAEQSARREAEAAFSAELSAHRGARESAEAALGSLTGELSAARSELAEALTRADALAQKVAALSARKPRKQPAGNAQRSTRESAQDNDETTELRALMELRADPGLWKPRMGGELARLLGVSPATGRRLHGRYVRNGALIDPISERSAEERDERSGERS